MQFLDGGSLGPRHHHFRWINKQAYRTFGKLIERSHTQVEGISIDETIFLLLGAIAANQRNKTTDAHYGVVARAIRDHGARTVS